MEVGFFKCGIIYDPNFDHGAMFNFFEGLQFPVNLTKIMDIKFNRSQYVMRDRVMRAAEQRDIYIPAGLPVAIFRVEWSEGDMDFHIVDPVGNIINKDSMAESPMKYFYRKNLNVPEAYYAINEPAEGGWQVVIPDAASVGDFRIEVLGGNHAPKIGMRNVSQGNAVTIAWTDKDPDDNAKVSLYYDTDNANVNGSLIVADIPEDDESDSYAWTPDDTVPSGTYYIYAKVDDGANIPQFSYSTETITIRNSKSPEAPTNLRGEVSETDIELSWDSSSSENIEGYVIHYTGKPHAVTYDESLAVGSRTEYTLQDLPTGRVYRISVTVYNTDGRKSVYASPIEIALNATNINNPPQIVSLPATDAKVGTEYIYQVEGTDVDGDALVYTLVDAPNGMQIDERTGVVSWIPSTAQVGNYDVKIQVDDGHGGADEQSYTIIVADKANYMPEAMLISPKGGEKIKGDYTIRWEASDKDKDTLTVALYYSSDGGTLYELLAENLDNTSEYVWDTTAVTDGEYKLQIVVKDKESEAVDISEEAFTIQNKLLPWDVNEDGAVDISDLVLVGINFGETGEDIVGDVNKDGVVDTADLVLVVSHFGE